MTSLSTNTPLLFSPWGVLPGGLQSDIPNTYSAVYELEPEVPEQIIDFVRSRLRSQQKLLITSVRDLREDQPAAFLQIGYTQSLAVCRIARYFPHGDFLSLIKDFQDILAKNLKVARNFDSIAKLKEIFLIPDEVANEIFSIKVRNKLPERLSNSPSAEECSRYSSECSLILLNALKEITESQLAKLNPIPVGTGFLVGATHLLTNYHVLFDKQVARQCVAQFNYEEPLEINQKEVDYEFDPDTLFIQELSLDYALVQLKFNQLNRQAGYKFGWLQLVEDNANIIPDLSEEQHILTQLEAEGYELSEEEKKGDNVILIHHPKGVQKKIDLTNNRVAPGGLYKRFLRYHGESDYGSSGCPVFNTKWELVALNHAAFPRLDGSFVKQGVRICRIVEDLKHKSTDDVKLQSFVEDFVITAEQLNYPPLPAGLKFDGVSDYVSTDSKIAFASCATNLRPSSDNRLSEAGIGTIKLWNSIGVELRTLMHPEVSKIEFSSDGQQLISVSGEGSPNPQLRLWDVNTGELIATLTSLDNSGQKEAKRELAIYKELQSTSPTVSSHTENAFDFPTILSSVDSLSLRPPHYEILAAASSLLDKIVLWHTKYKKILNLLDENLLKSYPELRDFQGSIVRFSPTGEILATSSKTAVQLWKVNGWKLLKTIETAEDPEIQEASKICFNGDGTIIAIANSSLKFVNVESGSISETIKANVGEIEFRTVNGTEVLMSFCKDNFVRSWSSDGTSHQEVEISLDVLQDSSQSKSFSPDGKVLLFFSLGNNISLYNLETEEIKRINYLKMRRPAEFPFAEAKFSPSAPVLDGIDTNSSDYTQTITVEAWVNPDLNGGGTIANIVLHLAKEQPINLSFGITADSSRLACLMFAGSGMGILDFGKFNHVAVVIKLEKGELRAISYINGREFNYGQSSSISIASLQAVASFSPRLNLIGAFLEQGANSTSTLVDYFKGAISEIRLWNTARSLEQIRENRFKRLDSTEEGLVEYWRFEGLENEKMFNLVSQNTSGISHGTKQLNANQLHGFSSPCGLEFSEGHNLTSTAFVDSHLNEGLKTAITIEAWVKHRFGHSLIVSRGSQDDQGNFLRQGYSIGLHDGKIRVVIQNESSQNIVAETRENAFQDQLWHHVAFTWAYNNSDYKQDGEISIYIDGRLQDSVVIKGCSKTVIAVGKSQAFGVFAGSLESVIDPVQIGVKAGGGKHRSVVIADVRIWNVCRPQDQIKANMSRRLNSNEEGLVGYWRLDEGSDERVINLVSKTPATIHGAKWFPMPTMSEQTSTIDAKPSES